MSEPDKTTPFPSPAPRPTDPASRLVNREISWLAFNRRVLQEAADPDNPLLERLKFIAIFDSNLDEFYMKRVGGLKQQLASQVRGLSPDGQSPHQQLQAIDAVVRPMLREQRRLLHDELIPALREHGVYLVRWDELTEPERRSLSRDFESRVLPILTPLAVDPAHPFPFISSMSLSLAVAIKGVTGERPRFARVKVPRSLQRWVKVGKRLRFLPLEDLVEHNLDRLFPGMELLGAYPFRVTRNADVRRDEETAEDLLEVIQEELRERRFATVVRLELEPGMPDWMRRLLHEQMSFEDRDVFELPGPLGLADLMQLASLPIAELRDPPWTPVAHPRLQPGARGEEPDLFAEIARGDILVHHPYDAFTSTVQRFVETAAQDPRVLAIKQTFYRTSADSPIMRALVRAAEEGKQIAVSVEIKARFDEANNIEWSEALENAGAHVGYGHVGLKNHAKIALVVREEGGSLRCYTHIGTGNYNPVSAKLYTDLGLLTSNPEISADVVKLFNLLTGYLHRPDFKRLLVAPVNMKTRFLELIDRELAHAETGRSGRIVAKMNGLEDPEIIDALYRASAAGVEIDLVVRGICRLRPGLAGISETVRVLSIVGRFLEHARIFCFGNGGHPEYFMGSADWMSRNLNYRVEAVVPVLEPAHQAELQEILDLQLADNVKAWEMRPDGTYVQRSPAPGEEPRSSQELLMQRALARAQRLRPEGG